MTRPASHPRPEPTASAFEGRSPGARLERLALATRPTFLPASMAPVLVGSAWGYRVAGRFDWVVFVLGLGATICVHLAGNVLNDVGDDLSGTDRINDERIFPYTGGSRFIQNGIMIAREMTVWGLTLLGIGALLGVALIDLRGPLVLVFGLTGVALSVFYSLPHVQLAARGLGEAAIAAAFGVLPVTGAAWLQSGRVDADSVLISIPVSLWVAAIVLMNEVPDRGADAKAGKRTLVVRLGATTTRRLYLTLHAAAVAAFILAGVLGQVSRYISIFALVLLPVAWRASRSIQEPCPPVREALHRAQLRRSIETTLRLHMVGTALLLAAILMAALHAK